MTETVDIVNIYVYVDIVNTLIIGSLSEEGRMAEQTSGSSDQPSHGLPNFFEHSDV